MNSLLRKVIVWLWKYSASRYMVKLWQFKARLHLHDFYSDMVRIDTIDSSYGKSPVAKMEPDYFTPGLYFRGKFKSLIRANFSGVKGYYAGEESICSKTGSSEYDSPRHLRVCTVYRGMSISDNQYITINILLSSWKWPLRSTFYILRLHQHFLCPEVFIICIMFLILCIFVTYVLCTK